MFRLHFFFYEIFFHDGCVATFFSDEGGKIVLSKLKPVLNNRCFSKSSRQLYTKNLPIQAHNPDLPMLLKTKYPILRPPTSPQECPPFAVRERFAENVVAVRLPLQDFSISGLKITSMISSTSSGVAARAVESVSLLMV